MGMPGQRLFLFLARFESGRIPGTAGNPIMSKNGTDIKEALPQNGEHETDLFHKYSFN